MKKLILISVIGMATLTGCGGDSNNNDHDSIAGNTISGTGLPPATSIGSVESVNAQQKTITVNGHRYHVSKVLYGPAELNLTDVKSDMIVRISSTTTALRTSALRTSGERAANDRVVVTLEPTMTGRVTAIDYANKTFTVNGIQLEFAGLNREVDQGDWVLVSSLPTADAGYSVLSVVKIDVDNHYPTLGDYYEIEGRISSTDTNASTFKLGADITVSYYNLNGLSIGQWVEVTSVMKNGERVATEIEFEDNDFDHGHWNGKEFECEGIVSNYNMNTRTFQITRCENEADKIIDNTVVIDSQTYFKDTIELNLNGARVEVEGVIIDNQNIARAIGLED